MHTLTLLAIALLVATGADASSPIDRPSTEDFRRLGGFTTYWSYYFEERINPDTNDEWDGLRSYFDVSKSQPVCLDGANDQSTCWTPTRLLDYFGHKYNVQAQSATAHPSNVVLQPFNPENPHPNEFLKVVTEHPNIVKPIARGQCKYQDGSPIAKCSAIAVEMPVMTVHDMLAEFVRNPNQSPPLEKSRVRKIVTDVAKGLQHIHTFGWLYESVHPKNVHLYKEPGSGQFIAKLGDFRLVKKSSIKKNPPNGWEDIDDLGHYFLRILAIMFYYKARKHTGTESPCAHPSPEDHWLASMCDMVANLYRILQKLTDYRDRWTLEQVLKDEWLNRTD